MPSYFYHIAIELFARPHSDLHGTYPGVDKHSTSLSFDSACEALLPFQKRPRHSPWAHRSSRHQAHGKHPRPSSNNFAETHGSDSTTNVTDPRTPPLYTTSSTSASDLERDLRLDKVSIECIDMIPSEQDTSATKRTGWKDAKDNPIATGIGTDILGGLRTKGKYIPLDQSTSDSVWGIVHLYRDAQETPYLTEEDYPSYLKGSAAAARTTYDEVGGSSRPPRPEEHMPDEDCTTLCILAVPSYMSPSDFLGFVGESTMNDVNHFRMIKTARANRYMVLMKFRNGKKGKEWQKDWNGKVFNSMEVSASCIASCRSTAAMLTRPCFSPKPVMLSS